MQRLRGLRYIRFALISKHKGKQQTERGTKPLTEAHFHNIAVLFKQD